MSQYRIQIGKGDLLTQLFAFPNAATVSDTLAATELYWFRQTLGNDGIDARASIEANASNDYTLTLDADDALAPKLALYADRVPKFLANGRDAIAGSVSQIRADGKWDPISTDPPPSYRPWRFFMPLGMAMVNQKSVQFFHYPPIRLLEQTRNYLEDPVPARCFELLQANGVPAGDLPLYNTVVDGAPIAAEDNQGSMQQYKGKAVGDPTWGLIPINYFNAYQKAQVELLLNPVGSAYTVVKDPARATFVYRDRLWQGADMAGLGVASFGHLNGVHIQNLDTWEAYSAAIDAGRIPLSRAYRPNADERLIRELVLQLKKGSIRPKYFSDKYGVSVLNRFADQFASLSAEGYLSEASDERVAISREGLLRVDLLLPRFFLPQHREIRYT